MKNLYIPQPVA